jgi:hypothetical protein
MKLLRKKINGWNQHKKAVSTKTLYINMTWLHSTRVIYWVKWYKAGFCKEAFVNGFSIRVLSNQGKGGDDTSLNALYLYCQNYQFLASKILKIWHDEHRKNNFWRDYYYCDENTFLNG